MINYAATICAIISGLGVASGLYLQNTNTILAFGFLLISLCTVWSKR